MIYDFRHKQRNIENLILHLNLNAQIIIERVTDDIIS